MMLLGGIWYLYECDIGHKMLSEVALEKCPVESAGEVCNNDLGECEEGTFDYRVTLSVVTASRYCRACGVALKQGQRIDAEYCSPACRQAAYRERRSEGEEEELSELLGRAGYFDGTGFLDV